MMTTRRLRGNRGASDGNCGPSNPLTTGHVDIGPFRLDLRGIVVRVAAHFDLTGGVDGLLSSIDPYSH
jgi:hypothetical protein